MVKVTCVICGKEFESQKSTKKYCSQECINASRRIKWAEGKADREQAKKDNPHQMPEKECLICNQKFRPKTPSANLRQCCYDCMPDGVQLHRTDFLNKLREKRGGKCVRCGYDTYLGALEFHHLDPSKKDFTLGNADFRLKEAVEEINKCILICANCHREFHANYWDLEDLNLEERDS